MNRALLFGIICFLISFSKVWSCSCSGFTYFEVSAQVSEFVGVVRVLEFDTQDSMIVEVVEHYIGEFKNNKIRIKGGNSSNCISDISYFKLGDYFLIAPSRANSAGEFYNLQKGDYYFFDCSAEFMKVDYDKRIATGYYSKRKKEITLDDFKNKLLQRTFYKRRWFVSNENKQFYESDSIVMYQFYNTTNKTYFESNKNFNNQLVRAKIRAYKLNGFTDVDFRTRGNLKWFQKDQYYNIDKTYSGKGKWNFDRNNNTLTFSVEGKPVQTFYISSRKRESIPRDNLDYIYNVIVLKRMENN